MKQFTSHLDFRLTRKRLGMMIRPFSLIRSGSKMAFLLPLVLMLGLIYCSDSSEDDFFYEYSDALYTVPNLHINVEKSRDQGISGNTHYTSSGAAYTGTQEFRFKKNDSLFSETYYENGIFAGSARYEDGEITHRSQVGIYYDDFYLKMEHVEGAIIHQDIIPVESEDGLGHVRKWHPNGQLSYEATYKDHYEYVGLMTLYDEEGNILEQELYEDGKLIEKIK